MISFWLSKAGSDLHENDPFNFVPDSLSKGKVTAARDIKLSEDSDPILSYKRNVVHRKLSSGSKCDNCWPIKSKLHCFWDKPLLLLVALVATEPRDSLVAVLDTALLLLPWNLFPPSPSYGVVNFNQTMSAALQTDSTVSFTFGLIKYC
jgi:hypothetical protein